MMTRLTATAIALISLQAVYGHINTAWPANVSTATNAGSMDFFANNGQSWVGGNTAFNSTPGRFNLYASSNLSSIIKTKSKLI